MADLAVFTECRGLIITQTDSGPHLQAPQGPCGRDWQPGEGESLYYVWQGHDVTLLWPVLSYLNISLMIKFIISNKHKMSGLWVYLTWRAKTDLSLI